MLSDPDAALDHPVHAALTSRHAGLARSKGRALSYDAQVATFSALPPEPEPEDWTDLAALLGPGAFADLFSSPHEPPAEWEQVFTLDGLQLVLDALPPRGDIEVVPLGAADSPAMRTLVGRTRPGPFWERTHEMGRYVGIRDGDALVAMAGERLRPPGATEISAVCTAPEARGRGLAAALVTDAAHAIAERGEQPFLHVAASNTGAIALYERLGFRVRQSVVFRGYRTPG